MQYQKKTHSPIPLENFRQELIEEEKFNRFNRFVTEVEASFSAHCELMSHFPLISEQEIEDGFGFVSYDVKSSKYNLKLSGEIDLESLKSYRYWVNFMNQSFVLRLYMICKQNGLIRSSKEVNSSFDGFISLKLLLSLKEYILRKSENHTVYESYNSQTKKIFNDYFITLFQDCSCEDISLSLDKKDYNKKSISYLINGIIQYAKGMFGC